MPYPEFHYRWEWDFQSSPEALWPFISDTNRYNRDAGAPPIRPVNDTERDLKNRRRVLRMSYLGIAVEYDEEPYEWIRPHRFAVLRRFAKGPLEYMKISAELQQLPSRGTHLIFEIWVRPKTLLGLAVIPTQIGFLARNRLRVAFREFDRLCLEGKLSLTTVGSKISRAGRFRLRQACKSLMDSTPFALVGRLIDLIEQGDDLSLNRIRPYALADYWRASRREVLELCLQATRAGVLDFQWDLLCPLCRGPQESETSLQEVRPDVHCDSCHIDFRANFDRLVEVTFRPNPSIRTVKRQEFCVGGPQVTPHIAVQQIVRAGEKLIIATTLETGRYRVRTHGLPGGQFLVADADGKPHVTFRADPTGWPSEEVRTTCRPSIQYENATEEEQLFVLERLSWTDQAVTAAEVTALQKFRDLFSSEVLRPGEEFAVGSMTFFFTDLRNSTRFYREVGDAPAYNYVVNHFDILKDAIASEGGAMVKTMGDAVMAAFTRPAAAIASLLKAQKGLLSIGRDKPFWLKAGVHTGTCIAVTLNNRLDYFGTTVNVAARLQGLSQGGDIVISSGIHEDPEVAEFLVRHNKQIVIEPIAARLRGLEEEQIQLWRLKPDYELWQ